ncbi:MAG: hypothetical protein H7Y42_06470 [Chitinophagaceae bacterium]|nr:hypothetical protein [Chitinophagaceae bacterium]
MKTIRLTALLLVFPLIFQAQSLTGLWTGTLSNDSSTIRKDQSFEILLTQYKDKVYGYSRMTFFVNDTLYYIVKRVKGSVEGDVCEVKDDDIISHNFPRKPDKGVKLVSVFRRAQDSVWSLDGDWKTTETKRHGYYSISGKMSLQTEPDIDKSKLISHLEELKLAEDIAFYQQARQSKTESLVAIQSASIQNREQIRPETKTRPAAEVVTMAEQPTAKISTKAEPMTNNADIIRKDENKVVKKETPQALSDNRGETVTPAIAKTTPVKQEVISTPPPAEQVVVKEQKPIQQKPVIREPIVESKPALQKPVESIAKQTKKEEKLVPKQETAIVSTEPVASEKKLETIASARTTTPVTQSTTIVKPTITEISPANRPMAGGAAAMIAERKLAVPQTVFFNSDSLELSLYDNGEVDGDTVSVLLNGELILARQGLKTSAIKKTIYVPKGQTDSLTLVLYAENLGKYPPNTGLLVVHDGDDVYQVRFTADFQQNAAVIFRRKGSGQ